MDMVNSTLTLLLRRRDLRDGKEQCSEIINSMSFRLDL
jgi:hypothetical protein